MLRASWIADEMIITKVKLVQDTTMSKQFDDTGLATVQLKLERSAVN